MKMNITNFYKREKKYYKNYPVSLLKVNQKSSASINMDASKQLHYIIRLINASHLACSAVTYFRIYYLVSLYAD